MQGKGSGLKKKPPLTPEEVTIRIMGCYPSSTIKDQSIYSQTLISLLEKYPEGVLQRLCDPQEGILGKCKFMPSISEVVQFADTLMKKKSRNFV